MEIRFANESDAEGIRQVYAEWSKFKGVLPDKLIAPQIKEDIADDITDKHKRYLYLVALVNKKIAGVCYIETSLIKLQTLRLGNVMVKEEYRRKGIASGLINEVKKFALENEVKKIWLWTQEELTGAINCYEKNGFKLEGKQKSQFCGKDALLYGLIL